MSTTFTPPEPDLFGVMTATPLPPAIGEKKRRQTQPKGYAAAPGSGPKGETCKTCAFSVHREGGAKSYPKCLLAREKWTGGPGSDIKMSAPACGMWKAPAGFGYVVFKNERGVRARRVAFISATADTIEAKGYTFVKRGDAWIWKAGTLDIETVVLERITLTESAS
jgi:hypothetical protein